MHELKSDLYRIIDINSGISCRICYVRKCHFVHRQCSEANASDSASTSIAPR